MPLIENIVKPEKPSVVPFEISHEEASHKFMRFFSRNKLSPVEFYEAAQKGAAVATYFPVCIFESDVLTRCTVECTKNQNGTVQRYMVTRSVSSSFSDIVISADEKKDNTLFELLEPYDLTKLQDYSEELLKDKEVTLSQTAAAELFELVYPTLKRLSLEQLHKELKGYSYRSPTSPEQSCTGIKATHALLPLWVLPVSYKNRDFFIYMNGQTGKIVGVPPMSRNKHLAFCAAAAAVGAMIAQLIWMAVTML